MTKKDDFPARIVLAEGYPYFMGEFGLEKVVGMSRETLKVDLERLDHPPTLWWPECPQYRLVLERVKK